MKKILTSKTTLVLLLIIVFGFLIAQSVSYPQYHRMLGFQLNDIKEGKIRGIAKLEINNDNWFSYSGKELTCEIFYKEIQIASGSYPNSFKIKRKSQSPIELNVEFYLDSLKEELKTFLLKDSVELEIKMHGKFSFLRIPISKTLKAKISAIEMVNNMVSSMMGEGGLHLSKIQLKELTPQNSVFHVGFKFSNRLPVDIFLEKIQFAIFDDKEENKRLAEVQFDVNENIQVGQEKEINGDANLDNLKSVFSGVIKVITKELIYYISGTASIRLDNRQILIPISQAFRVDPATRQVIIIKPNE